MLQERLLPRGDPGVTTATSHPPDIEARRNFFIGDGAVARLNKLGLLAPGGDLGRVFRMRGQPAFDRAAPLGRKLAVDISVEFVFADIEVINHRSLSLFHAAQRRALAVEIGFDLQAGAGQPRHYRSNRDALHFSDLAIGESFEHDEEQRRTLLLGEFLEGAGDIATARVGSAVAASPSLIGASTGRREIDRSRLRLRLVKIV
jgi:hypothetical protein